MRKTFKMITLTAAATMVFAFASQSFAATSGFTDLGNNAGKNEIISLQQRGLIKGISADQFAPHATMTAAQGVQLIVNALDLNLDLVRFFKEPKATDYFVNANDKAWYADALIIAAVNGLDLPKDLNPNKQLTREEFTHELIHAIEVTGKLPMIKPVVVEIADQDQINIEYSGSITRALNYGVIKLGEDGKVNPKVIITRSEAAVEIYNALAYMKAHAAPIDANSKVSIKQGNEMIGAAIGVTPSLSENADPSAAFTREAFITQLVKAVEEAGKLPLINVVVTEIKDADQIDVVNSGAIQRSLSYGIVKLSSDGSFNPKGEITYGEASEAINNAVAYLKAHPAPDAR
ncbi:S-layer homology domain-containing protein [Paenibacillus lignilyticus]|uniref:S-layer homology domain-containing protein n=1 Tax=Paenibacillus lignilyticus TaxID=1172615 RepID=A0ABS5CB76_9BACL|nr:S-layer homology domain-containing protein [Paenibacillus lignilyticus]MBP3963231.1 S-layer homology domain-containing protein [Paenibacillus lignilyticus]